MASTVTLAPLSNREDYIESFTAYDEDGVAINLTTATIVFAVVEKNGGSEVLSASTTDGKITVSTTVATITIPKAEVADIDPKDYNVGCTILLNSVTKQFFIGTMQIYDGYVA
jgi:hypothetical protein